MSSVDVEKIQQAARRSIEDDLGVPVFESIPSCLYPETPCGPGLCEDPRWCISDAWDSPEDEQRG